VNNSCHLRQLAPAGFPRNCCGILAAIAVLIFFQALSATAQQSGQMSSKQGTIQGVVLADQKPIADARVRLEPEDATGVTETATGAAGNFAFSGLQAGGYRLVAKKAGIHSRVIEVVLSAPGEKEKVVLILQGARSLPPRPGTGSSAPATPMEFADTPNFTVAGITDWTAVGGHGSDSILRTSEALARDTLALKPEGQPPAKGSSNTADTNESEARLRAALAEAPNSFTDNHRLGEFYLHAGSYREAVPLLEKAYRIDPSDTQNEYDLARAYEGNGNFKLALERVNELLTHQNRADLHRLAGELNEKMGHPLAAVHEYQQAVRLDPSEQNYFAWGSELLFHRAVWQAQEVFRDGVKAYPQSSRMQTALGTALFAGALYDKAALRLCAASDLNPANIEPYVFMGKVELASPDPLPCVEAKLARFLREQPKNSLANYLYAMAILKRHQLSTDTRAMQQAEALLEKAVRLDATCGKAYLQLGILAYSQRDVPKAIDFYKKAIEASPQLGESYYRLGVAYDRLGETAKARLQFQRHDKIEKKQEEAVNSQRRQIKQFLIVDSGKPAQPPTQ